MAFSLVLEREAHLVAFGGEHFGLVALYRPDGALLRALVFAAHVVLVAASITLGLAYVVLEGTHVHSRVDTTILQMGEVNKQIELYALRHGVQRGLDGLEHVYGGEEPPRDAWGRPFFYVPTLGGPRGDWDLVSFGRDGAIGGTGLDADIRWTEQ